MKCGDGQWIWSKKKGDNIGGLIMLIVKKYHTEAVKEWEQIGIFFSPFLLNRFQF